MTTCNGDSGGPAIATRTDGTQVEVGITSLGDGTCNPSTPAVYTRTDQISSWVQEWIDAVEDGPTERGPTADVGGLLGRETGDQFGRGPSAETDDQGRQRFAGTWSSRASKISTGPSSAPSSILRIDREPGGGRGPGSDPWAMSPAAEEVGLGAFTNPTRGSRPRMRSCGDSRAASESLSRYPGSTAIISEMGAGLTEPQSEGTAPRRILVVDDEPNIADVLSIALRFNHYEVETAADGQAALRAVAEFRPDLVLLDVMLPDLDGFEVARLMRERADDTPILFLTARDTTEDKVRGLTIGGDDYVTKPFSVEELLARVGSVLRRFGNAGGGESLLRFADLELDDDTREVFRDGAPIELTDTEYRLLRYLMSHPRRVLTRAQILDHVWDYDFGGDARVLETYVSYLRKKLEARGPRLIHTVRGVGYALRLPPA